MIISEEQLEKRLNSDSNIAREEVTTKVEVEIVDHINNHIGRPNSKNLSEQERIAIGVLANTVGEEVAAELMGVSIHTAHKLRSGQRNVALVDGNTKDMDLTKAIQDRLESTKLTIQEKAADKLLKAFECLTDDKLNNSSAKEVSQIANQMSQVIRNVTRKEVSGEGQTGKVKITLHQPKPSSEDHFETIEIGVS